MGYLEDRLKIGQAYPFEYHHDERAIVDADFREA